ncbi:MAG: hypothetical protein ABIJ09_23205 [Pseudomonadota bacterium]
MSSSLSRLSTTVLVAAVLTPLLLQAQKPAPAASQPASPDSRFRWGFVKNQPLKYSLKQTVSVRGGVPGNETRPPMNIEGSFEILPVSRTTAHVIMLAELQLPPTPAAPAEPASSCSCRRVSTPPKPATTPPPPALPRSLQARFNLEADGSLRGMAMNAGGQTELLARLLLPLPTRDLNPGESDIADIDAPPVADRMGLLGKRTITYVENRIVDGHTLAVLRTQVEMKGEAHPGAGHDEPGHPPKGPEGSMELKAEGEGLFDLTAGHYTRSSSSVRLQIQTTRTVNGVKQALSVEQQQDTRIELVESTTP